MSKSKKLTSGVALTMLNLNRKKPTFQTRLIAMQNLGKVKNDPVWLKEALRITDKVSDSIIAMRDAWFSLKYKQPFMETIQKSSRYPHPELVSALETVKTESKSLITNISISVLAKHHLMRRVFEHLRKQETEVNNEWLGYFKKRWGILLLMVDHIKHPVVPGAPVSKFYKDLEGDLLQQRRDGIQRAAHVGKTIGLFFEKAVRKQLREMLGVSETDKRILHMDTVDDGAYHILLQHERVLGVTNTSNGTATNCTTGTDDKFPLTIETIDVNVVKDKQCNPCVGVRFEFDP